jgi:hypothetical protein
MGGFEMKRLATLLISLSLLLSLVACGGESTPSNAGTASVSASSGELSENESEEESKGEKEVTFEEITVVDNEQCLIKITGIEPDNMWGYTLKTYLENKSADKTFMFSIDSAAINGVQADPFFATKVAAGKKSNEEISFSDSNLSANGIDDFTDIELSFRVYDSNDWSADSVARETVHVYPFGEESATAFVRENQSTDTVVVDNDSATVIVTGYSEDSIWGYTVNLYLINKTDKELTYSVDEASVNGFMADPFWASSVSAGKVAFASMSWSTSDFEENDITTVEEIEMKLRIYNSDDWSADDIFNETVTLNP